MPEWMLSLFASQQLNQIFWLCSVITLPFWLLMLLFPETGLTRFLCQPFRAPMLYVFFWLYLLYEFFQLGLPSATSFLNFADFSSWVSHPLPFLLLWVQVQTMNLLIGTILYEKESRGLGYRLWPEMLITWAFGPLGMVVYCVRVGLRGLFLRTKKNPATR